MLLCEWQSAADTDKMEEVSSVFDWLIGRTVSTASFCRHLGMRAICDCSLCADAI
jgi:hypothetical protein